MSNGIPSQYNLSIVEGGIKHHKPISLTELVCIRIDNT